MDVNKDTPSKGISKFLNRKIVKNIKEDDDNIETNFEKLNRNEFKSKKIDKINSDIKIKNYEDNYNSYNNNTSNNNKNLNYKNYNNTSDYDKMKKI